MTTPQKEVLFPWANSSSLKTTSPGAAPPRRVERSTFVKPQHRDAPQPSIAGALPCGSGTAAPCLSLRKQSAEH